jgi:hypothetical protein
MLKMSASGVLAMQNRSTYRKGTPRSFALLRPCWTAILSILGIRRWEASGVNIHWVVGCLRITMVQMFMMIQGGKRNGADIRE